MKIAYFRTAKTRLSLAKYKGLLDDYNNLNLILKGFKLNFILLD